MLSSDSLKNRGVQIAVVSSLAWHAFWLFGITASFAPSEAVRKPTRIYFLGPVLTDDSFNMLLASKPELSATRYVPETPAAGELEPPLENLGRRSLGDLVSVPTGRATWSLLRGVLQTDPVRSSPVFAERFNIDIARSPFPITGALARRGLVHVPPPPLRFAGMGDDDLFFSDAAFELTVSARGDVKRVDILSSTGNPERDLAWQNYLKKWQFYPLEFSDVEEKGQVRIRPSFGDLRP